jgi:hypothetical protein
VPYTICNPPASVYTGLSGSAPTPRTYSIPGLTGGLDRSLLDSTAVSGGCATYDSPQINVFQPVIDLTPQMTALQNDVAGYSATTKSLQEQFRVQLLNMEGRLRYNEGLVQQMYNYYSGYAGGSNHTDGPTILGGGHGGGGGGKGGGGGGGGGGGPAGGGGGWGFGGGLGLGGGGWGCNGGVNGLNIWATMPFNFMGAFLGGIGMIRCREIAIVPHYMTRGCACIYGGYTNSDYTGDSEYIEFGFNFPTGYMYSPYVEGGGWRYNRPAAPTEVVSDLDRLGPKLMWYNDRFSGAGARNSSREYLGFSPVSGNLQSSASIHSRIRLNSAYGALSASSYEYNAALTVNAHDSGPNNVTRGLQLRRWRTVADGTYAAGGNGMGVDLTYWGEISANTMLEMAAVEAQFDNLASHYCSMRFYLDPGTGIAEMARFKSVTGDFRLGVPSTLTVGLSLASAGAAYETILKAATTPTASATYLLPPAMPASTKYLTSTSGGVMAWATAVTSVSSNSNQITVSPTTGAVIIDGLGTASSPTFRALTLVGADASAPSYTLGMGVGAYPTLALTCSDDSGGSLLIDMSATASCYTTFKGALHTNQFLYSYDGTDYIWQVASIWNTDHWEMVIGGCGAITSRVDINVGATALLTMTSANMLVNGTAQITRLGLGAAADASYPCYIKDNNRFCKFEYNASNYWTLESSSFGWCIIQSSGNAGAMQGVNSGGKVFWEVTNGSGDADSHAALTATTAATAGDPFVWLYVGTARGYALGIDNSDNDTFKLTTVAGWDLTPSSGTTLLSITSAGYVTFSGDRINVASTHTPANAGDTGVAGDVCWDSGYVYVCTASNTWKRAGIATW